MVPLFSDTAGSFVIVHASWIAESSGQNHPAWKLPSGVLYVSRTLANGNILSNVEVFMFLYCFVASEGFKLEEGVVQQIEPWNVSYLSSSYYSLACFWRSVRSGLWILLQKLWFEALLREALIEGTCMFLSLHAPPSFPLSSGSVCVWLFFRYSVLIEIKFSTRALNLTGYY